MEEPKSAIPTTQNVPQSQPPKSKKRPLDISNLQSTPYYKMRLIVKELRPHVIEVLRTPDFRNCKAATEIRQQLNLLMDLYKEMAAETIKPEKAKDSPEAHPMSIDDAEQKDVKPPEDGAPTKASEDNLPSQKEQTGDAEVQGTYVVGGSAFGWNFITYPCAKTIYYGRSKESFRSASVKSE